MNKRILAALVLLFLNFLNPLINGFTFVYAENGDIISEIGVMESYGASGNYQECIQTADRILAGDKTVMKAYDAKSMALFRQGKAEDAYKVLEEQLKLNPNNEIALYNAACTCSKLGKSDKANEYLQMLLSMDITRKNDILKDSDFNALKKTEKFKLLTGISVRVGGELLIPDVSPIIINGRTMIPMRSIFEALGAELSWNSKEKKVTAVKGSITITATINKKTANVSGEVKELEAPPVIIEGRTMVPVRFVSEALGADVSWDKNNKLVEILTDAPENTDAGYDDVKQQLDSLVEVSVIDGIWPHPYILDTTECMVIIISKDTKALDLMNSMDSDSRAKYMYMAASESYGSAVGCEVAHMKFVYEGKVYYSGDVNYQKNDENVKLTYFEKGLPVNVVKQDKAAYNYKDFYLLQAAE